MSVFCRSGKGRRTRLLLPRVEVLAVGVYGAGGVTTTARNGEADDEETRATGVILPALFIVVIGPGVINIMTSLFGR